MGHGSMGPLEGKQGSENFEAKKMASFLKD